MYKHTYIYNLILTFLQLKLKLCHTCHLSTMDYRPEHVHHAPQLLTWTQGVNRDVTTFFGVKIPCVRLFHWRSLKSGRTKCAFRSQHFGHVFREWTSPVKPHQGMAQALVILVPVITLLCGSLIRRMRGRRWRLLTEPQYSVWKCLKE